MVPGPARLVLAVLTFFFVQLSSPVAAQPSASTRYIVVFDTVTPFDVAGFAAGTFDDRALTNPTAWTYLDRLVLGVVQACRSAPESDMLLGHPAAIRSSRFAVRGSQFAVHSSRFAVRGSEF